MRKLVFAVTLVLLIGIPVISGCAGTAPPPQPAPPPASGTVTGPGTQTEPGTEKTPSPSDLVPRITPEELLQKIEQKDNILIIDTRQGVETAFAEGHIKGAIAVPSAEILNKQWAAPENKDQEIVLYCT